MSDVKVGDWIVSLTDKMDFTEGKEYEVIRVEYDGDAWVIDDVGEVCRFLKCQFVRKVTTETIEEIKLPREFHIEYNGEKIHVVEVLKS